jgi:hypothetical protein
MEGPFPDFGDGFLRSETGFTTVRLSGSTLI